jgi:hypothetical protein
VSIIGEITKGKEIGKQPPWKQYLWASCPDCGKERWVQAKQGTPDHFLCKQCYTKHHNLNNNWNWKGGRTTCMGYTAVKCRNHPRAHKRTGYVLEHILVWEQVHNKSVPVGSHIHHINGIKTDNRLSNLVCLSSSKHATEHQTLTQVRLQRIRELESEVKMLENTLSQSQMIFRLEEN